MKSPKSFTLAEIGAFDFTQRRYRSVSGQVLDSLINSAYVMPRFSTFGKVHTLRPQVSKSVTPRGSETSRTNVEPSSEIRVWALEPAVLGESRTSWKSSLSEISSPRRFAASLIDEPPEMEASWSKASWRTPWSFKDRRIWRASSGTSVGFMHLRDIAHTKNKGSGWDQIKHYGGCPGLPWRATCIAIAISETCTIHGVFQKIHVFLTPSRLTLRKKSMNIWVEQAGQTLLN